MVRVDLGTLTAPDDADIALQVLASIVRTAAGFGLTVIAGGIATPAQRTAVLDAGAQLVHERTHPDGLGLDEIAELLAVLPRPRRAAEHDRPRLLDGAPAQPPGGSVVAMTSDDRNAAVRLLFVCTGNLCRSAAADRLLTDWARAAPGRSVAVRSAGTLARPGRAIHPSTARALRAHGVSGAGFESSRLSEEYIHWADLVLTMTAEHRDDAVAVSPRALHKCFTLLEAAALASALTQQRAQLPAGRRGAAVAAALRDTRMQFARAKGSEFDVVDPIDGPDELHGRVVDQIAGALAALLPLLEGADHGEPTVRMPRLPPVPHPSWPPAVDVRPRRSAQA
ncbi:arsenate reductase/protein-tyrosine-phosphatase family protein [Blastococcus deserti]|uniref:EAL domain-containing protein n=1 Tax=Blastococcus deserti TaxID=2259033 RepID=A0ABW4XBF1_9ACTN